MEKSFTKADANIIGPAICNTHSKKTASGPLLVEVYQCDDEHRISSVEVATFDVSSWSADRFQMFWEFMHTTEPAVHRQEPGA
jgi:hypothetical protein